MSESNPALFYGRIPEDAEFIVDVFPGTYFFGFGIRIGVKFPDGRIALAQPLTFAEHTPGMEAASFLTLNDHNVSKLAAAIDRAGIRLPGQESIETQGNRITDLKDRVSDLKADKDKLLDHVLKTANGKGAT